MLTKKNYSYIRQRVIAKFKKEIIKIKPEDLPKPRFPVLPSKRIPDKTKNIPRKDKYKDKNLGQGDF